MNFASFFSRRVNGKVISEKFLMKRRKKENERSNDLTSLTGVGGGILTSASIRSGFIISPSAVSLNHRKSIFVWKKDILIHLKIN